MKSFDCGVSMDAEQPLDGALNPQEKPKKGHRILSDAFGNTSVLLESVLTTSVHI